MTASVLLRRYTSAKNDVAERMGVHHPVTGITLYDDRTVGLRLRQHVAKTAVASFPMFALPRNASGPKERHPCKAHHTHIVSIADRPKRAIVVRRGPDKPDLGRWPLGSSAELGDPTTRYSSLRISQCPSRTVGTSSADGTPTRVFRAFMVGHAFRCVGRGFGVLSIARLIPCAHASAGSQPAEQNGRKPFSLLLNSLIVGFLFDPPVTDGLLIALPFSDPHCPTE